MLLSHMYIVHCTDMCNVYHLFINVDLILRSIVDFIASTFQKCEVHRSYIVLIFNYSTLLNIV